MKFNTTHCIFFSPTSTSRKIARGIAEGVAVENIKSTDLTHVLCGDINVAENELAIIAVPVYGGSVAPTAAERLKSVRGNNTPAILVAVYGNREFDGALTELHALAVTQGFHPVAAAAFIGEHSFSRPETPVATGRPDAKDIRSATAFGKEVAEKLIPVVTLDHLPSLDMTTVPHPKKYFPELLGFIFDVMRLKIVRPEMPRIPDTDAEKCTGCGACVKSCPVNAISADDMLHSDVARCIRCCACVKNCPAGARHFDSPFAKILAKRSARRKEPTWKIV